MKYKMSYRAKLIFLHIANNKKYQTKMYKKIKNTWKKKNSNKIHLKKHHSISIIKSVLMS